MSRLIVTVRDYLDFPAITSYLQDHESDETAIVTGDTVSLPGTPLYAVVSETDQLKNRSQI